MLTALRLIFIKKIKDVLYDGLPFFQWILEMDKKPIVKGGSQ